MSLFSPSVAGTGDGTAARKQRAGGESGSRTSGAAAVSGGRSAAPAPISRVSRLRSSVWWPAVTKGAAITLGMLALATIGAVFTLRHPPGVALAHGNSVVIDSAWIKPDSPSSALGSHAPRAQRSDPSLSATRPADNDANTTADAPSSSGAPDSPDTPAPGSGITADGKVILNTATAEELTHLPGVGPKRAQAIVALRARLKRFKSPSDLLRVKGIGPKGLKKMLPHLVLDPPPPTAPS